MKTIILVFITLFIALGTNAKKAITGNSNTFFEAYKVSQINENLYELTYSNSTEKFIVEVCPEDEKCCYLLRGKHIEVMYVCNELGLVLRKMPDYSQKMNTNTYCKLINNRAFSYQSLLTPIQKNKKKALGLIACFFPEVINKDSQTMVFNPQKKDNNSKLTTNN